MTDKRFTFDIRTIGNKAYTQWYDNKKPINSAETICDLLNGLNEENEQLKCGNKNLKATLNDFINICNRLQSNPNDKQTVAVARDMLQNMGVDLK